MSKVTLKLGRLLGSDVDDLSVTPESLFGRHLAIIGTSGGGKSWTLAKTVEEVAKHRPKVILFDSVGEFADTPEGTWHCYIGDKDRRDDSIEVSVPYFHLTESDLFAILKPKGPIQVTKLKDALRSLKLARLAPFLAPDGTIIKADKNKHHFEEEYRHFLKEIENPYADIEIENLIRQLQNECVDPQRSALEPRVWGSANGRQLAECTPLINKVQDIIHSPNLAPIFRPNDLASIFEHMRAFFKDEQASILRVSLENLSFFHNAREITMNAIGRHLLRLARRGVFRQRPLLCFLDEAHQFLNTSFDEQDLELESFRLIAKEGRKYSLTVCLATQRPRDIPEDILSQMGAMIVHRLVNDNDRGVVERATSEMDSNASNMIPKLGPGEAVLSGVDFPEPLLIKVTPPIHKPDSSGANYQKFWAK